MAKTIRITSAVDEETPSGTMPTIQVTPSGGIPYEEKAILDTDIPVAGSVVLTPPVNFDAFGYTVRIFSEEAAPADVSDNFEVAVLYRGPAGGPYTASATCLYLPTPDLDEAIQLTVAARGSMGAPTHGVMDLISITVTDLDALHADDTHATLEAFRA